MKLTKEKFEEYTKNVAVQDAEIKEKTETTKTKQTDCDSRLKVVEEARKVNAVEKDKHNKYTKANAALKAKLEFIEAKYDYSSTAKAMSIEDFKELIQSNLNVNSAVNGFTTKLEVVQKEIQTIEAMNNMM